MSILRRKATLPAPIRQSLRTRCREAGVEQRVLAEAPGQGTGDQQQWAVALATHLAYGVAGDWVLVAWHDIDHGTWNGETSTLEIDQRGAVVDGLVRPGGRRHRIRLLDPQRVPEVMADRVAATILVNQQVPVPDSTATLTVTARRNLANQDLNWFANPSRRVRPDDPDVQAFAAAVIRRFRHQYE